MQACDLVSYTEMFQALYKVGPLSTNKPEKGPGKFRQGDKHILVPLRMCMAMYSNYKDPPTTHPALLLLFCVLTVSAVGKVSLKGKEISSLKEKKGKAC